MLRRCLLTLLSGLLVAAPAGAAIAQETPGAEAEAEVETVGPSSGLQTLADLVELLLAVDLGTPADGEQGEDAAVETPEELTALLDAILDGLKVETLIATATATGDDPDTDTDTEAAEAGDEPHGEVVSTIARCAPRGQGLRGLVDSVRNHGEIVRVAARGGEVTLTVPQLALDGTDGPVTTGEDEQITHELSSVAAAEALCADLEVVARAAELSRTLASDDDRGPRPDRGHGADRAEKGGKGAAGRSRGEAAREAAAARRDEARAERRDAKAERAQSRDGRGRGARAEGAGGR